MLAAQPSEVAQQASSIGWIEAALVIFLVIFLGIVLWVIFARPGAFNRAARIPLDDQNVATPRSDSEHQS